MEYVTRTLINELFDFDYKWEIYTPENQREYSYYVLPILYGDRFIGRIEVVSDRKTKSLIVKHIMFPCRDLQLLMNL